MILFKRTISIYALVTIALFATVCVAKQQSIKSSTSVEDITDVKEFKKLLRTKNNVLVLFVSTTKRAYNIIKMFREAAEVVKGQGTMVFIDCYGEAGKKTCKKLKVNPDPFIMKHYKDGDFHRDYDRLLSVQSVVAFMRDPTGDAPWEEDAASADVVHLADISALNRAIKKDSKPLLVMFYAPWCGFCKQLKPEYAQAATDLRGQAVLAAIDVNRPENSAVRQLYNISGFPTMLFFQNGNMKFTYEGDNKREALVSFMRNPQQTTEKPKQEEWSETESNVLHLTESTFDAKLKEHNSVLVMFYAPWCGHCKKMKPEYEAAATKMIDQNISGKLAGVDVTKEASLGTKFNIKGYPTVKYFRNGEFAFDANVRDAERIVDFMREPKEPPPPPPPETPWNQEKSEVVHLNDETFKPFLKKKKHVLVMFYAPWCGHCKKAKPEFNQAAEKFKEDSKVEFAAVDCTTQSGVCSANDVKGYPTIKYFHYYNKETASYSGGRTAPEFIAFMQDPQNPPAPPAPPSPQDEWGNLKGADSLLHLTEANFTSALQQRDLVLVMFYAPWCGHCKAMKADYATAAARVKSELKDSWLAAVDATQQPNLQKQHEVRGFPTLKLFRKGKFVADYNKPRKTEDLVAFMSTPPSGSKDEL